MSGLAVNRNACHAKHCHDGGVFVSGCGAGHCKRPTGARYACRIFYFNGLRCRDYFSVTFATLYSTFRGSQSQSACFSGNPCNAAVVLSRECDFSRARSRASRFGLWRNCASKRASASAAYPCACHEFSIVDSTDRCALRGCVGGSRDPTRAIFSKGLLAPVQILRERPALRRLALASFIYSGVQLCFIAFLTVHLTSKAGFDLFD